MEPDPRPPTLEYVTPKPPRADVASFIARFACLCVAVVGVLVIFFGGPPRWGVVVAMLGATGAVVLPAMRNSRK